MVTGNFNPIQPNFSKLTKEADTGEYGFQPNINHATINSYPTEREAFRHSITEILSRANTITIMIDTYDMKMGLKTLIEEMKNIPKKEQEKIYVPIDSGKILPQAKYIRKELDRNGLNHVKITSYSNLQEYKIDALEKKKAPIDCYVCVTEVTNVTDAPALELVFKIAETVTLNGKIEYKAKLTKGKESFPGKKQVFRQYHTNGKMEKDIIGLENEKLGEPRLKQFIKNGKRVIQKENLLDVKKRFKENFEKLPQYAKEIYCKQKYPVETSEKVKQLVEQIKKENML
jgi:nicotinate phosphoribosyltransferase